MDTGSEVVAVVALLVIAAFFVVIKLLPDECCDCLMGGLDNERIIDREGDVEDGGFFVRTDGSSSDDSAEVSNKTN